MAPREDLITSAISFLQDPSVAAAPLEKRRAFLESKSLTAEEIELSFARVGTTPPASSSPSQSSYGYPPPQYQQAPPYNYGGYPSYPPGGPWAQQAMMEPPRRDWRDWFIMATVTSGIGYGLYQVGKRYVLPLIKPPTPEQLEQDKMEISTQFDRAFALIEQLAADTTELKKAESERNEKLDKALEDIESVIGDLRTANERREQESRRVADDVNSLRDTIPKALEGWKTDKDAMINELGGELKSLKTLLSNRLQQTSSASPVRATSQQANGVGQGYGSAPSAGGDESTSGTPAAPLSSSAATTENSSGSATAAGQAVPAPASKRPNRAAIPAWQMAAAQKPAQSGTISESDNSTQQ